MASGITLSVLDLSPVPEGQDAGQALRNSLDLARHTEVLGIAVIGWRNTTTCRASRAQPLRSS